MIFVTVVLKEWLDWKSIFNVLRQEWIQIMGDVFIKFFLNVKKMYNYELKTICKILEGVHAVRSPDIQLDLLFNKFISGLKSKWVIIK